LLPYSVRQVTQRSKGRRDRGDRGDRGELRLPSSTPTSQSAPSPAGDEIQESIGFGDGEVGELDLADLNGSGDFDAVDADDIDAGDLDTGDDE